MILIPIILFWIICGLCGALIEGNYYKRKQLTQHAIGFDIMLNILYGPVALFSSWIAYKDK